MFEGLRCRWFAAVCICAGMAASWTPPADAATRQKRYYAHDAVEDRFGVIAPWYRGQDGPAAFRVRIAAETLKRYPWIGPPRSAAHVPEYLLSSFWSITPEGTIVTRPLDDWMNGDRGQLSSYVLRVMTEYYRYSGDPAAKAHLSMQADLVVDLMQTPASHPWPGFCISVPVKGKPYGPCDPRGFIQLDIVGRAGYGLLRAYEATGQRRWLATAQRWGDVLAAKRNREPGAAPWMRYANPETVPWGKNNQLTGGVVWIAKFLDELIRVGHTGGRNEIVEARDAARKYLRDALLPAWLVHDTWGRHYWDWEQPTQAMNITPSVAEYFMDHPEFFPQWRNDARNILSLALNRACVGPASGGEVFSGAWAYPESCSCCGRCLSAGPWLLSPAWARYGVEAGSPWAAELARRQLILCLYDITPHGAAEDNIDGGVVTNGSWFESTHLLPLETALGVMAWQPEIFAPPRENHMVRCASTVRRIEYGKGRIDYETFDAPPAAIDVFRLAFVPRAIAAAGIPLARRNDLSANGYTVKTLSCGDAIVSVRRDGACRVAIEGDDPQEVVQAGGLAYHGQWRSGGDGAAAAGEVRTSPYAGAAAAWRFTGNQVRLIGRVDPAGGLADVYLDGVKQPAPVDCWNPRPQQRQTLYAISGLAQQPHDLKLVVRGTRNPRSEGDHVWVEAVQWSAATGQSGFGEGGGPTDAQRWILGYPKREDYVDASGHRWKPGCEFVVRAGDGADSVAAAWHTAPCREPIAGARDEELYRYGVHGRELIAQFTVGPGVYSVRLKFAATRRLDTRRNRVTVRINGREMATGIDVAAKAGGPNRTLDLTFPRIEPVHGIVEVRLVGHSTFKAPVPHRKDGAPVAAEAAPAEAFLQALEILPGDGA